MPCVSGEADADQVRRSAAESHVSLGRYLGKIVDGQKLLLLFALVMILVGGLGGGLIGARIAKRLSGTTGTLSVVFAGMIFVVASYMLWKTVNAV